MPFVLLTKQYILVNGEMHMKSGNKQFKQKCLCSLIIILIYIVGQNIPVPWVKIMPAEEAGSGIFENIRSVIGSSSRIVSLFYMGIMPWMTSSILLQLVNFSRSKKKRLSNSDMKLMTHIIAVVFCAVMTWMQTGNMLYDSLLGGSLAATRAAVTAILTLGTVAVIYMAEKNTDKGMGGISLFILVNIVRSMENLLPEFSIFGGRAVLFAVMSLLAAFGIVWMEEAEFRMPSHKIMIYNEMSEKGHFALKFAPIGIQPLMYVMGFFMVPYFVFTILAGIWEDNPLFISIARRINYSNPYGLTLFCVSFVFVTAALIAIYVNPEEIADEMQRSGECLVGLHPGRETQLYIAHMLKLMGTLSTAMIMVMAVFPLALGSALKMDPRFSSLPMNCMILAGIIKLLRQEMEAMRVLDRYKEVF